MAEPFYSDDSLEAKGLQPKEIQRDRAEARPEKTITVELTEANAAAFLATRRGDAALIDGQDRIRAALATPSQEEQPRCPGTCNAVVLDSGYCNGCGGWALPEEKTWECDSCGKWAPLDSDGWEETPQDDAGVSVERCPECRLHPPQPDHLPVPEEAGGSPEWCQHYSEATIEEAHERGVRCFQVLTEQDTTAELAVMAAIDNAAAVLTAAIKQSEPEPPAVPEHVEGDGGDE